MGVENQRDENPVVTIYTVGHSNGLLGDFIQLLQGHNIESLVDVRSSPFSRYVPHFNRTDLEYSIEKHKVRYTYLGDELGGRPDGDEFYDEHGHVLYYRVAKSPLFRRGLDKLIEEGAVYRTAIMCSEEDPVHCHRRLLIARVLMDEGASIVHIRSDNSEQPEQGIVIKAPSLWSTIDTNEQEDAEWKSIRPVSRRRPQNNSSSQYDLWGSDDF